MFFRKDDSHEFRPLLAEIEEKPVNPLGRITFWIVVSIIVFLSLWLYFGKVDVVVSARGKVIPDGEIKILQPLDAGIVSKIFVKEGDFVKKGQVLMEIDPSETKPELASVQENLENLNLEIQRLKAVSTGGSFIPSKNSDSARTQKELYSASLTGLNSQLEGKKIELSKINEQVNAARIEKSNLESQLKTNVEKEQRLMAVIDIIAKDQYDQVKSEIQNYKAGIKKLDHKLEELAYQKDQVEKEISYIQQNFKSNNLKELAQKQQHAVQLIADAQQLAFKNSKQKIVAPVDGYVDKILVHTIGGVVTPAQKLIALVPKDSPLVIKATLLNKDIGFIKEGMPVSIKVDTFSFQKYGLLDGVVKHVAKNSIDDEKLGPVYEAYITPVTKTLMVEGREETISSGMSLSAEIKVGKRRIIEFFIYPLIKYLNEGISVK